MKEYMVKIWGGAWNSDANPSILKDLGIDEGCYYFNTEKERDDFIKILRQDKYDKQGLMTWKNEGELSHRRTIFIYKLKYKNKIYDMEYDFGYEYPVESAIYMFTEGNYSCDCNRSDFIRKKYGEDEIEELPCGEEIKLINYRFEFRK